MSDMVAQTEQMRHNRPTMLTLKAEKRTQTGKGVGALRRAGALPAVVYGPHKESMPITLSAQDFEKVFRKAGESTIVALTGIGEDLPTLVHEIDLDPLTNKPRHVDFYAVTKGQKVELAIPVEFTGESLAVKEGASLVKVLHEIEIKADPMNLPHEFVADLSMLKAVGDKLHVRDLVAFEGVELITNPDEVIALIQEVVEEKVEEAPTDLSAIEVEQKGKEEGAVEGAPASEVKEKEKA